MIKVTVSDLTGNVTHSGEFPDDASASAWVLSQQASGVFGKNERWVLDSDLERFGENSANAIDSQDVGGPDELHKQYHFAAEYVITKADITAQLAQEKAKADALAYLDSTDWIVLKAFETNTAVPSDVLASRAAARMTLNR